MKDIEVDRFKFQFFVTLLNPIYLYTLLKNTMRFVLCSYNENNAYGHPFFH